MLATIFVTVEASDGSLIGSDSFTLTVNDVIPDLITGLVASYPFDGDTNDASGNGNDGTLNGASWTNGKSGSALSFNGSSDEVNIPHSDSLNIQGDFTIEAWIKTQSPVQQGFIFWKYRKSTPYPGYGFLFNADGTIRTLTGDVTWDYSTSKVPVDTWTHVAVTLSGNTLTHYINGNPDPPQQATRHRVGRGMQQLVLMTRLISLKE